MKRSILSTTAVFSLAVASYGCGVETEPTIHMQPVTDVDSDSDLSPAVRGAQVQLGTVATEQEVGNFTQEFEDDPDPTTTTTTTSTTEPATTDVITVIDGPATVGEPAVRGEQTQVATTVPITTNPDEEENCTTVTADLDGDGVYEIYIVCE